MYDILYTIIVLFLQSGTGGKMEIRLEKAAANNFKVYRLQKWNT